MWKKGDHNTFCIFGEKKHKKSDWEKLCRQERLLQAKSLKDTAR